MEEAALIAHNGVVDNDLRPGAAVAAHMGVGQAGVINGQAFGNAVPQEGHGVEMFTADPPKRRQPHHPCIGSCILKVNGLFHRIAVVPG